MSSGNKTVPIVVGAVATVAAVVGAVVLLKGRGGHKAEDDEDAFSSTQPVAPKKIVKKATPAPVETVKPAPAKPAATAAAAAAVEPAAAKPAPKPSDDMDDLLDAALDEAVPKAVVAAESPVSDPPSTVVRTSTALDGDRTELAHLGVSVKVPSGWEVREELSPVPNVAMVTVWNPEFASMPNAEVPGAVPVIILSVEDIHGENLNLIEFKERSKELSMQQMLMMTGGAIQPVVRRDASISEGSFRHILEYSQSMPPFFDIAVINLLEVRNGVAYVFQIMANPKVLSDYKSLFMQIARDTVLTPMESSSLGYLRVNTGKVSVEIDTVWSWMLPAADAGSDAPLATFELASTVKKETIALYETAKVPATEHKTRSEKTVDDVQVTSAFDGMKERKVFSYGGYSFVVEPYHKAVSFLPEAAVARALKSVDASSEDPKPKNGATFVTSEYGYRFDVLGGSRVVSTKLGKGTVVYAPLGVPQDPTKEISPDEQGPTVTIRLGKPEEDPDCMGSIEEWKARIEAESASSDISGIKVIEMKNENCLTFKSKEMQETGPNEKTEVTGEVYIFVRDGVTTLIRWEATRSQWRKYEQDLRIFLESFEFLAA